MNLEQMRKRFQELRDAIKGFQEKEALTADEEKSLDASLNEAEELKVKMEAATARGERMKSLVEFGRDQEGAPPIVAKGTGSQPQARSNGGENVYESRKDGSFGLTYTDDPLFGNETLMKEIGSDQYRKCFALIAKAGAQDPYRHLDADDRKFVSDVMRKAAQVGVDEDGGFLVPPQMVNEVVRQRAGATSVTGLVRRQQTTAAAIQLLRYEDSGDDIYTNKMRIAWTGEGSAPNKQDQPKLSPLVIPVHEGEIEVALTRTFLEDAPGAVNSYIGDEFRTSFDLGTESVVIAGDGIAKPTGIVTRTGEIYGPAAVNIGNPVTADNLIKGYYKLPAQYRANSRIVMRNSVFGDLQTLQDNNGNYIFGVQANFDGLAVNAQERLRATPILFSDFLEDSGAGKRVALHGDFSTYMMVVRLGMTMRMRDIPGQQPAAVFRFRFGGDLLMGRGIKVWVQS